MHLWLPPKFQSDNPEFVKNLKVNRDRLSSPFDIYVTLQHILNLNLPIDDKPEAISCPTCQSLFSELPFNRTCADAAVDKQWCACADFEAVDEKTHVVRQATSFVLNQLNAELAALPRCAKLKLNKISSARRSSQELSGVIDFLIAFDVLPSKGQLEATVRCATRIAVASSSSVRSHASTDMEHKVPASRTQIYESSVIAHEMPSRWTVNQL